MYFGGVAVVRSVDKAALKWLCGILVLVCVAATRHFSGRHPPQSQNGNKSNLAMTVAVRPTQKIKVSKSSCTHRGVKTGYPESKGSVFQSIHQARRLPAPRTPSRCMMRCMPLTVSLAGCLGDPTVVCTISGISASHLKSEAMSTFIKVLGSAVLY